jgi:hypothetical protein
VKIIQYGLMLPRWIMDWIVAHQLTAIATIVVVIMTPMLHVVAYIVPANTLPST